MNLYLDIGSTNIKYKTSEKNDVFSIPFPKPVIDNYPLFEVNVDQILDIVKTIIEKTEPSNVFISTQMHGYILLKDGKPVSNYISWRDQRGKNEKPIFNLNDEYGVHVKNNLPRLSIQTQKVLFDEYASLGSYVCLALTNNNVSHITDLAASGFYNIINKKPDCVKFRLPIAKYNGVPIGLYNEIKIHPSFGDHQCSIYGLSKKINLFSTYILNIGTASQLCVVENKFIKGDFETRPFFNGNYLLTITGLPGGEILQKLSSEEIEKNVFNEYKKAISLLPKRTTIIVTGGGSQKHKDIFDSLFNELGIKCIFNNEADAVEGLKILAEQEINMKKIGLMISEIPHHSIPLILKQSGLDFCILDYEHGGFNYESMSNIILTSRLSDFNTIVRIPNNKRKDIIKCLDMGANGLLLPMTNTPEDIKKVVEYAKYPPIGKRGVSTMRAHTLYNPGSIIEYTKKANEQIKVYAQIETKLGVENVNKIVAVDNVAGVMVGPNDLSADYGCLGDKNAQQILDAIKMISKACKKYDKEFAIITGNKNYLDCAKECGYTMFCIGSELNAIANYAKQIKKDNE